MSIRNLNRLFQPRSVAVIGASPKEFSIGKILLENLVSQGFSGHVYPINPKYSQIEGRPCLKCVAELREQVDLAIICTPAASIPELVEECGQASVANVLIISAGFREVGAAGLRIEEAVATNALKYPDMRIVGPNCLGILYPHGGLNASFARTLPKPGRTAFISQSGALCTAIMDWAIDVDIGFSVVASLGNAMDVDLGDMIDYLATDPYTDSIVLYIESIRDARKFMSAARAFTRTKPIVAYKAGRFAASAKAAASHTGAMVGEDCVYDAALERAGIVRVREMSDLFNCAEVLARGRLPRGDRLAIVSNAGGPGIMAVDALLARHGTLATISHATVEQLNQHLPSTWSHQNPIDILGDASAARFGAAVTCALDDSNVDGLLVLLTPQAMTEPTESAEAVCAAASKSTKTILAVWMGGPAVSAGIEELNRAGIPNFQSPEQAVAAFDYMVQYGRRRDSLYEIARPSSISFHLSASERSAQASSKSGMLNEIESKAILAAYDIPTNETLLATDASQAVEIARHISQPVALKIVSPDISHKSNVGGVLLNLQGDTAVAAAFEAIVQSARHFKPEAKISGVSVQPMVLDPKAVELILGVKRDPTFGAVLMVGSGGTLAELVHDRVVELPPLDEQLARRMLESMRTWPLLNGFRGRPAVNIEQLIDTLVRLSCMVIERPEIIELDINPLLVTPKSVIAVDARMVLEQVSLRPSRPADEPKGIAMLESSSNAQVIREALVSLDFTQGMPAAAIDQLTAIAALKSYPAGRVLFNESDYHPYLHIVLDGLVILEMRLPGHGSRKILTLGRGDILAWSSFLTDGVMTTTAIAAEGTQVVEFSTDALRTLCEQNHELGYFVMRKVSVSLARRLLATRLQLLDLFHDGAQ
ncbi:MAG: acetate--CoA ligase family protein [Pirellulaceae bacterium]|nr:acetate--CoA ligase family protein [Pirellulaceae bacterium]